MQILILEITSLISFIFSILLILFNKVDIREIYIIFIYFNFIMILYSLLLHKSKLWNFILLLLPLLLIFFNDNNSIYLISVSSVVFIYYSLSSLGKGDSYSFSRKLKFSYVLYLILAFIGIVSVRFRLLIYKSIPFILIYIVTMILLIRNLRNQEHMLSSRKSKKQIYIYLFGVFIVSLIGSLPGVRAFIINSVEKLYILMANTIFKVGYFIIAVIANIFFGFFGLFIDNEISKKNVDVLLENISRNNTTGNENNYVPTLRNISPILNIIIAIIVLSFIAFIIIKIVKVKGKRSIEGLSYTEKREFIKLEKRKTIIKRDLYLYKNNREKVRYYYKKYLKSLTKDNVKLKSSDTSLDILKKAENQVLNNKDIREIYIKSRYSSKDIKEKDIEEMKKYIK